ncbi:unnamed protein product [Effrenium voratum]|uniref:ShKT domain-containing protein n=1 Tax=Effrenium voratum TaxID=2562239 RepID=A0AA36JQW0_9DINO|nr:unnamed protein product [Effrenium voratum]CAJ1435630.1 unnamed protein product [Effrenium voratum]
MSPTAAPRDLRGVRLALVLAALLLALAAGLKLRQSGSGLELAGALCGGLAVSGTSSRCPRECKGPMLSFGMVAHLGAVLALMDGNVLSEAMSLLSQFAEMPPLVPLSCCVLCLAVHLLSLAYLPGYICASARSHGGAADWTDLERRSPVPVCCISVSILSFAKFTLLTALMSSLLAGLYTALHPKVVDLLSLPWGLAAGLLPLPLLSCGVVWAWPPGPRDLDLSGRARLARRTLGLAFCGAAVLFGAWLSRLVDLQSNWTSCENMLAECSAWAGRGDCSAESKFFEYMMEKCKKACRFCSLSRLGLTGDLLLALGTALVIQTTRFAYLFHQSTMQLVIADNNLSEPETPFQALEEVPKVQVQQVETELAQPREHRETNSEARASEESHRSLLHSEVRSRSASPLPRVNLDRSPQGRSSDEDNASFYECESQAGDEAS